jgi:hypothetical protein
MIQSLFFILFTHFAVGLMFLTLFISLHEIGKLYFRATTGVAFALILLALLASPLGLTSSNFNGMETGLPQKAAFLLFCVSLALIAVFNLILPRHYKKILVAILVSGLLGVLFYSETARAATPHVEWWTMILNTVSSTLMLGAVLGAMITGHWYLVQHKLSLTPLKTSARIYLFSVLLRIVSVAAALLWASETAALAGWLASFDFRGYLFMARVAVGLLLPLVFGWMTWSAVKIGSTQSATGILYATVVLTLLGETFGNVLFRMTGIPM